MALVSLAAALAAAASAVAAAPGSGPEAPAGTALPKCILGHDLGNHSVVDQNTLIWDAVGRSKGLYRVTMRNGCLRSAVSADPLQQVGGGRICAPKDLRIIARGGLCDVASIVKLTPQEAAALPRRLRP